MKKVLLIDDDKEVLEINAKMLMKHGYRVFSVTNAEAGKRVIQKESPDCIVLDVMMEKKDGFTACREYREITDAPIIFLTGKGAEQDMIKGFKLGADDYIVKPYRLSELALRIMANIRRRNMGAAANDNIIEYPPLYINTQEHKVYCDKDEIQLSNREYELLILLVENVNSTVTYEMIGKKMWNSYSDTDRKTIMVNASRLRKKFDGYVGLSNMIETVWTKGYKFIFRTNTNK